MFMKGKSKKIISLVVALIIGLTSVAFASVPAYAIGQKPSYSITSEISSNKTKTTEYFKIRTPLNVKNVIYVEGKVKTTVKRLCIRLKKHKGSTYYITTFVTPNKKGEFSIKISTKKGNKKVPTVINRKGTVAKATANYSTMPGYKAVGTMTSGIYHLTIAEAKTTSDAKLTGKWWKGGLGGTKGYAFRTLLRVKSGDSNNLKLIKYNSVISNNKAKTNSLEPNKNTITSYKGSYVRYTDKYLTDASFMLVNPHNGTTATALTTKQVDYISKVANSITKSTDSNYTKVKKIYEYVANNFYYDNLAYKYKKNQYGHPYYNLYNMRNKIKSKNSDSYGRVGTVCFGYAGMVTALARAEGIPARLVEGRHITLGNNVWSELSLSSLNKNTHWWCEVWVNGRWITIDADGGSSNTWERSSFSSKGTYSKLGATTYTWFDPSNEVLANNYITHKIRGGSNLGKYLANRNEAIKLQKFLNTKYESTTNGYKLNTKYVSSSISTWGNGVQNNLNTDGYGNLYRIVWGNEGLYGNMDLSNFKSLSYVTIHSNKLTGLNLDGCTNLKGLWAGYNDLKTFDSTDSKSLKTIVMKGNKFTNAKFIANGKTVTLNSNYLDCSFGFKMEGNKVTIYSNKVPVGYEYLGIYDSNGNKLSHSTEYSFTASSEYSKTYTVKYKVI